MTLIEIKGHIWCGVGISLFSLMMAIACQKEEVSDEKFMSFDQEDQGWADRYYGPTMMKKVHADNWNIAYGFYDPDKRI